MTTQVRKGRKYSLLVETKGEVTYIIRDEARVLYSYSERLGSAALRKYEALEGKFRREQRQNPNVFGLRFTTHAQEAR